jgi:Putative restriction endonuclease
MIETIQKLDTSAFYEGDKEMTEHAWQHTLINYLESVLRWLYYKEGWFVIGNLDVVSDQITHPISPDIMFFKSVSLEQAEIQDLSIWRIELPHRPPPTVVFEIGSKSTGKANIEQKPEIFRVLGVKEYFAFDPKTYWGKRQSVRLKGWRYANKVQTDIEPDEQERLWSEELECFVAAENSYLRLYDRNGNQLLDEVTGKVQEAKAQERNFFLEKLRSKGINPEDLGL